ncbi:hypothetical protein FRC02_010823 [Tulasnella sp. 418]|nr:hypothetical protein FRC02_010823 [Tulasnella sp. 418]
MAYARRTEVVHVTLDGRTRRQTRALRNVLNVLLGSPNHLMVIAEHVRRIARRARVQPVHAINAVLGSRLMEMIVANVSLKLRHPVQMAVSRSRQVDVGPVHRFARPVQVQHPVIA